MKFYRLPVGMLQTNCYILACEKTGKAVIVDPGAEPDKIEALLEKEGLEPVMIINTHGHFDHIGCNGYFHRRGIPVAIHSADSGLMMDGGGASLAGIPTELNEKPDILLEEGGSVEFGNEKIEVIFTPGHTPGHIALWHREGKKLFSGDSLFFRSIGRTDLPGGDYDLLLETLNEKILTLPADTEVFPGHGPSTDIMSEKRFNPWFQ